MIASLMIAVSLYGAGLAALWHKGRRRSIRPWQAAAFAVGWLVLAVALLSPLHEMSEQLFSAHMVQHELLMVVAAPLLVLGRPLVAMVWAFPRTWRHAIGRAVNGRAPRSVLSVLNTPFDAWLIHGLAIWVWHVPLLFDAALENEAVHAAQHLSFVGSALLFWWTIIYPPRRSARGMSVVYLFTTAVHTSVLGALMTMARSPWYPRYASRSAAFGLTPLGDQALAGMIMWIPASIAYLIAALLIARRWLGDSDLEVRRREQPAMRSHLTDLRTPT